MDCVVELLEELVVITNTILYFLLYLSFDLDKRHSCYGWLIGLLEELVAVLTESNLFVCLIDWLTL